MVVAYAPRMRLALRVMWAGIGAALVGAAGLLFNHAWIGTWLLIVGGAVALVSAAVAGLLV